MKIERHGLIRSALTRFAQSATDQVQIWHPEEDLENRISSLALNTVLYSAVALVVLVIIAALVKDRIPKLKLPLFILMMISMAGSVLLLLGSTIYLNTNSDSRGPIHWHADVEYWACSNELELRDPTGTLSNKIGTAVLHEHDDQRVHLEGVVVEKEQDASLGKFMFVVGGAITGDLLKVPLNEDADTWFENDFDGDGPATTNTALVTEFITNEEDGAVATFSSGQKCGDEVAEVQVFVYKIDEKNDVYYQEKLTQPQFYAISEEPNVPPGDCIIFEFEPAKDRTDRLCAQFGIRDIDRCEEFGVEESKRGICTLHEVHSVSAEGKVIEFSDVIDVEPAELQPLENQPTTTDSEATGA